MAHRTDDRPALWTVGEESPSDGKSIATDGTAIYETGDSGELDMNYTTSHNIVCVKNFVVENGKPPVEVFDTLDEKTV